MLAISNGTTLDIGTTLLRPCRIASSSRIHVSKSWPCTAIADTMSCKQVVLPSTS